MKIAANQIEGYLRRLDPAISVYLLYGPDQGLAAERAKRLLTLVVNDLQDPFLVADLDADRLRQEPGRLIEEAQAMSMIGGRRVVRVRQAGDFATKMVQPLLSLETIEALVVIEGGDLAASSSLRKLCEKAKNALALPCYRDEGRSIGVLVDSCLREAGKTIARDARDHLITLLGVDHELSRREIDKLILVHGPTNDRPIELGDVIAAVGDSAALAIDDWIFALLLGDVASAAAMGDRLIGEGQAPIRLLRVMLMTLRRLLVLRLEPGDPSTLVNQARPPLHFRQRPLFEKTLRRWSAHDLAEAIAATAACEEACKKTGSPNQLLLAHYAASLAHQPTRSTNRR